MAIGYQMNLNNLETAKNLFMSDSVNCLDKIKLLEKLKQKREFRQANEALQMVRAYKAHDLKNCDTFHGAIKPCLFIAQLFGLMPLVNMLSTNPQHLRFTIRCVPIIFTFLFLLFGILRAISYTEKLLSVGINPKNIVSLVFHYIVIAICLLFVKLARQWPQTMRYWTRVEIIYLLPPYLVEPEAKDKRSLRFKIRGIAIIFAIVGAVEHSLFLAAGYNEYKNRLWHCNQTIASFTDFVSFRFQDAINTEQRRHNYLVKLYALFLNIAFNFIWNFLDVFIILVSLGLTERFQQFAVRVAKLNKRFVTDELWYEIRQHHLQLCELLESVDSQLSNIILLSALNDFYFICYQILNIFTKLRFTIDYVYFWFSLTFLLFRSFSVFIFASRIHEEAIKPLKTLHLVPSGYWTQEVQRFITQITNDCIGLTGNRFYLVSRRALFGLIASIVTYEFMLLQFDANNRNKSLPDLCA